jgi:hypothetical protein
LCSWILRLRSKTRSTGASIKVVRWMSGMDIGFFGWVKYCFFLN